MKDRPDAESVFAALTALAASRKRTRARGIQTARAMRQKRNGLRRAAKRKRRAKHLANRRAAYVRDAPSRARQCTQRRRGARIQDAMLLAMVPGEWHAPYDLVRAIGAARCASGKLAQKLLPAGMVRRAMNPEWRPERVIGFAQSYTPKHLYQLTELGEIERAELEALALAG